MHRWPTHRFGWYQLSGWPHISGAETACRNRCRHRPDAVAAANDLRPRRGVALTDYASPGDVGIGERPTYRRALAAAAGPELDADELWLRYRQGSLYASVAPLITAGMGGSRSKALRWKVFDAALPR
jgi:hypothetical protein